VQFIAGSTCTLNRTYVSGSAPTPTPSPRQYSFTMSGAVGTYTYGPPLYSGTYRFTATCSSLTSSAVTVIWPAS